MLDLIDYKTESIQLCEIFILDKIILASDIQDLEGLVAALEEYLFVLSREIIIDSLHLIYILISGRG